MLTLDSNLAWHPVCNRRNHSRASEARILVTVLEKAKIPLFHEQGIRCCRCKFPCYRANIPVFQKQWFLCFRGKISVP